MCTDRTLNEHIKKYHNISEQIKALEELKKAESDYIIAELDDRQIDKYETVKITKRTDERLNKRTALEFFPDIWEKYKTVSTSRFLRACKA